MCWSVDVRAVYIEYVGAESFYNKEFGHGLSLLLLLARRSSENRLTKRSVKFKSSPTGILVDRSRASCLLPTDYLIFHHLPIPRSGQLDDDPCQHEAGEEEGAEGGVVVNDGEQAQGREYERDGGEDGIEWRFEGAF